MLVNLVKPIRLLAFPIAGIAIAAAVMSGCAGGTALPHTTMGGGGGASCVAAVAPAATEIIGLNLTNQNTCTDPTYQMVLGFFGGSSVTTSQVVSLTSSSTDIVKFMNLDTINPHTAASLGPWSGSYPANGPNAQATPSPANTDISATGFTTGNLNPGATSKKYLADVPGMYIIGCAYHYVSNGMRTVIIVQ